MVTLVASARRLRLLRAHLLRPRRGHLRLPGHRLRVGSMTWMTKFLFDRANMKASETQVGGTHYKDMGEFQPWDVLQHWLTPEEYRGYQKGVVIAYLARERGKGGDQDIRKAAHHLNKLVEVLDAAETQHAATAPVVFPGQPEYSPDEVALAFGIYPGVVRMAESFGASLAELDVVAANAADDGWIPWGGGECPVPVGTPVEVRHRGGAKYVGYALQSNGMLSVYWRTGSSNIPFNHHGDIIAYRVVRPA